MRQVPELEAVFVMPKALNSWLEAETMELGRARFLAAFAEAGVRERVRFLHPAVERGGIRADVMVHSKVMIVDDVLLHVGSSNLNNRSMGLDSECDLAIEAKSPQERAAIRRVRDALLAHHCGKAEGDLFPASGARSLVQAVSRGGCAGHSLLPIASPLPSEAESAAILAEIGDAERPVALPVFMRDFVGERPPARRVGKVAKLIGMALVVITLVLAWRMTPLADFTDPERVRRWAAALAEMDAAPAVVVGAFVLGSLIAFPVTLMIAATAATFGPLFGFLYAALGVLVSGVVTYFLGIWLARAWHARCAGRSAHQPHPAGHPAARRARDRGGAPPADRAVYAREPRRGSKPRPALGFCGGHCRWHTPRPNGDVTSGPSDLQRYDAADI
jgi:hypothetical protein